MYQISVSSTRQTPYKTFLYIFLFYLCIDLHSHFIIPLIQLFIALTTNAKNRKRTHSASHSSVCLFFLSTCLFLKLQKRSYKTIRKKHIILLVQTFFMVLLRKNQSIQHIDIRNIAYRLFLCSFSFVRDFSLKHFEMSKQ